MTTHRLYPSHGLRSTLAFVRVLWLALALAACGGGGGGVEIGGTGRVASASGPITGFGSVVVNEVHFDDSSATVTDADGNVRGRDELRLGMTTDISGSAISTDASGTSVSTATSIVFGSEILGRVESIDAAGGHFVALGQTVDINAATVFDDTSLAGGLAALAVGDVVEVYGLFDAASGHYTATRIERKSAVTALRLRGIVSNFDAAAKAFNIGSVRISYAGFGGPLPATLANSNFVRVRLATAPVGGVWPVAALGDGTHKPGDADEARIEGLISAYTSPTRFSVNGVVVDASGANPPTGIALGVRVEVEGRSSGGVLIATEVKIKTPGDVAGQDFELRGLISAVNAPGLSFVLRGVTVNYTPAGTDFRNGTAAGLVVGAVVEARGTLSADGTRLIASRITFR